MATRSGQLCILILKHIYIKLGGYYSEKFIIFGKNKTEYLKMIYSIHKKKTTTTEDLAIIVRKSLQSDPLFR